MKKLELESLSYSGGPKSTESNARFPKLPYFDEKTDQMDSYLTRFESYATACKWDPAMWSLYLSALLKGRALEVFVRLSKEDQSDYEQIRRPFLIISTLQKGSLRESLGRVGLKNQKHLGSLAVEWHNTDTHLCREACRQTDTQTDRHTHLCREPYRQTDTHTHTRTHTPLQRTVQTDTHIYAENHTARQTDTHTHLCTEPCRQTHTHIDTHTHTNTENHAARQTNIHPHK